MHRLVTKCDSPDIMILVVRSPCIATERVEHVNEHMPAIVLERTPVGTILSGIEISASFQLHGHARYGQ